uniref:pectin lyase n=1 Tax=Fusarium clavum TaxID=2594811 RepID=A0A090MIX6_9HYPO|nr:unnamed protein product [Fusarium clavum]
MRFQASFAALLAAAATASAQSVAGKAYGFAAGVTGGSGEAVTPSTAEELAKLLADDTPRVIYIDKEFDFTGQTKTGPGCDRKSCSASNGGQLYLGDLSCGGDDNVAVSSITYDAAGPEPLPIGSNKSIIGNGKAVLKGKGLSVKKGSSNVIIQGIEITNLNPGIVWGGDALELKGENDGVWIDHCKFSKVGRMFIVSHYDGARVTISNSEFDGVTDTSASCNGNHYWTMMFYGKGDQVTLDRNHFHDVAGRAPKLGEPGTNLYVHATNNYFQNMKGHAFDAYSGANAIIEGNVFDGVDQPLTKEAAGVNTLFVPDAAAAAACQAALGRACEPNSATSSGDLPVMKGESGLNAVGQNKDKIITPVSASEVVGLVVGKAGPAGVGSGSTPASGSGSEKPAETAPVASETTSESAPESAPTQQAPAQDYEQSAPSAAPQNDYDQSAPVAPAAPQNDYDQSAPIAFEQEDCDEETASAPAAQETQATPVADDCDGESEYKSEAPVVTQAAVESNAEDDCAEESDYESAPAPKETAASAPSAPSAQADCDEESDYDSKPEAPKQTQAATPVADCDEEEPTAKAEPKPAAPQKDCDDEEGVQAAAKDTPAKETPKKEEASGSSTVQMYGQCGGANFSGSTKCAAGSTCKKVNEYYSQCLGNSRVRRYMHTYLENETQP